MTLPDIALLQTGFIHLHPGKDEQGPVVICDFSRTIRVAEEAKGWDESLMTERCTMYHCTNCPNEDSQTKGAALLYPVRSDGSCIVGFRSRLWDFILCGAPVKLTTLLVAQSYEPEKQALLEYLRYQTSSIIGYNSRRSPHQICAYSVAQTVQQLHAAGVRRDAVPVYLGGSFDVDAKIADWTRMRISIEGAYDNHPTCHPRTLMKSPTKRKQRHHDDHIDMPEEDFNRRRNALYSRRMYHKRKLAILSLDEEIKFWKDRNEAARMEQERLNGLLNEAINVLVAHGQLGYTGILDDSAHHHHHHGIAYSPAVASASTTHQPRHQLNSFGIPSSLGMPPDFDGNMFDSSLTDAFDHELLRKKLCLHFFT